LREQGAVARREGAAEAALGGGDRGRRGARGGLDGHAGAGVEAREGELLGADFGEEGLPAHGGGSYAAPRRVTKKGARMRRRMWDAGRGCRSAPCVRFLLREDVD